MRVDLVEVLTLTIECFKSFYYSFCHALMSLLRAADDGKVLACGDTLVAVYLV